MRILMVTESLFPAAAPSETVRTTSEDLRALGHDLTLLPLSRLSHASPAALRRILGRMRPEVVLAVSPLLLGSRMLGAARDMGIPSVALREEGARTRASLAQRPWMRPAWDRFLGSVHREATLNLGTTRAALDRLTSLGSPEVFPWSPGTDTTLFSPSRRSERVRAKLCPRPGRILVGFLGNLTSSQQIEDLRVVQSLPGVRLVVIGEGVEHQRLAETLHQATFLGRLAGAELAEHLASLDVLVQPSEGMGSGRAVREAMACGVVPVAVGTGGALDPIEHGSTGLHYAPGRLDQLRTAVEDLQNPQTRHRLAEAAHAVMQTRSRTAAAYELEALLRRAQELGPARAGARAQRSVQGSAASTPQAR